MGKDALLDRSSHDYSGCGVDEMKKYQIIYADPPWKYAFPGTRVKRADDYSTMTTDEICSIPIVNIADENCVLFVWGIWTAIEDCLKVIRAWGFEYKTVGFVWVKTKSDHAKQYTFLPEESFDDFFGMGMWTRSNTEYLLIGTKGKPSPISHSVKQLVYAPMRKHSQKPNEVSERIVELMGNLPRIELFARTNDKIDQYETRGWDVWGNEVESDIDLGGYVDSATRGREDRDLT